MSVKDIIKIVEEVKNVYYGSQLEKEEMADKVRRHLENKKVTK